MLASGLCREDTYICHSDIYLQLYEPEVLLVFIDLSLGKHGLDHLVYVFVGLVVAIGILVLKVEAHIAGTLMSQLEGVVSLFEAAENQQSFMRLLDVLCVVTDVSGRDIIRFLVIDLCIIKKKESLPFLLVSSSMTQHTFSTYVKSCFSMILIIWERISFSIHTKTRPSTISLLEKWSWEKSSVVMVPSGLAGLTPEVFHLGLIRIASTFSVRASRLVLTS